MVCSKDMKKAIAFGLILGAILSLCNLCFASEDVSFSGTISNANLGTSTIDSGSFTIYYLNIEPGFLYHVSVSGDPGVYAFGNYNTIGSETAGRLFANKGTSFDFTYSDYKYAFFLNRSTGSAAGYIPTVSITREPLQGLTGFVDNMAFSLSLGDLTNVFTIVVPIIAISVLFGLGWFLIRKILNKTKRAKGGGF